MDERSILSYHVKHSRVLDDLFVKAEKVAHYAVKNKDDFKKLSSKYVKDIGMPSAVSNQILRKYGRGTIKEAKNINIIIPNQITVNKGSGKEYRSIIYNKEKETVYLKPLKMTFRWNPGKEFEKINQVEISKNRFMISCTFKDKSLREDCLDTLGIDLNCGVGRHIVNAANLKTKEVINLGRQGPNMRKKYFKKRKSHLVKGFKERRIMKDLDHKISREIVNYALRNKLKIVLEDLKGIRTSKPKGKGSKACNRLVNSWSFYRLQQMIEYKSKELGIPLIKVNPHYTSQQCSYCKVLGLRDRKSFICKNKKCCSFNKKRNSDVNAAFNIGKRGSEVSSEQNTAT